MTQRIDGSQSSYPAASLESAEVERKEEAVSTETGEETPVQEGGLSREDTFEKWLGPHFQEFVNPRPPGEPPGADGSVGSAPLEEPPRAVWEMIGGGDEDVAIGAAQEAAPATEISTNDPPGLSENPVADALGRAFAEIAGTRPTEATVRRELRIEVFDKMHPMQQEAFLEVAGSREELRAYLLEIHNDPGLADQVISEVSAKVVAMGGEEMTKIAGPHLRESMESVAAINDSRDSRRAFLATVVLRAESQTEIQWALQNFGLTSTNAARLAEGLEGLRTDSHQMQAFLDGERGDRSLSSLRGEFDTLERRFQGELSSIHSGLESLERGLRTNQIRHDRFLTEPTLAPFREEVFARMGAEIGPGGAGNGLGEVFQEAIDASEKSEKGERGARTFVALVGTAALTVATGGMAVGAAAVAGGVTTLASNVPDRLIASQDVHRAQGAARAELASAGWVEKARQDRNIGHALALGDTLMGMIPAQVIVDDDAVRQFGVDMARSIFSEVRSLGAERFGRNG